MADVYNRAPGTANENGIVFPANFCKVLSETVFFCKMDSRSEVNLLFFSLGSKKACLVESERKPKKGTICRGTRIDFFRPIK